MTPYGIYDLQRNEGMVNVGMSYDTSEFAVESIRQWWLLFASKNYYAKGLIICVDVGGVMEVEIKAGNFIYRNW